MTVACKCGQEYPTDAALREHCTGAPMGIVGRFDPHHLPVDGRRAIQAAAAAERGGHAR